MMMLLLLSVILVTLFVVSLYCSSNEMHTPSVLFTFGFVLAVFAALLFSDSWKFQLHYNTFLVFVVGPFTFVCISTFVHWLNGKARKRPSEKYVKIEVRKLALVGLILLQIIVFVWSLWTICKLCPASSVSESIAKFKASNTFTTVALDFGTPLRQLRAFTVASGYFAAFLVGQDLATNWKKTSPLCVLSLIVCIGIALETGGRSNAVCLLLSTLVALMLVRKLSNQKKLKIKVGLLAAIGVLCVVFVILFRVSGIGRNDGIDFVEYFSMYIGGQIPNLDLFLNENDGANPIGYGCQTFRNLINYIGSKLGIQSFIYTADLPFRKMNGYELGNVYSAFYPFFYDFGMLGVFSMTAIMALISQIMHNTVLNSNGSRLQEIWICIYLYMSFGLIMSFFGSTFFDSVFQITFIHTLIYLSLIHLVIVKKPSFESCPSIVKSTTIFAGLTRIRLCRPRSDRLSQKMVR